MLGAVLAMSAAACGRIGYGLVPDDGRAGPDASRDATSDTVGDGQQLPDATGVEAATEADAPEPVDAGPEAAPGDAPEPSPDASDAAPEAEAGCPDDAGIDYCRALPAMAAVPVIDGVLDLSPCALVDAPPQSWIGPTPLPPFPPGNAARIAAAWRPDGVYLFVDVTTPAYFPAEAPPSEAGTPAFYGAGVELFVDDDGVYAAPPAYDDPGTIQIVVTAPASPTAPAAIAEMYRNAADEGPWTSTRFGTFPTATGFAFEGFVQAADLGLTTWSLSAGATVGLDVAVDVSYPTESMTGAQGHRVGQYFFHVAAADAGIGLPYGDPRSFCAPTLAAP